MSQSQYLVFWQDSIVLAKKQASLLSHIWNVASKLVRTGLNLIISGFSLGQWYVPKEIWKWGKERCIRPTI
jgi:hypothetical protein